MIRGWVDAIGEFLKQNQIDWAQVQGVALAIPGPYKRYGVMDRTPNLPANFEGWEVHKDYSAALAAKTGRSVPLVMGNDGNYGGVAEARLARGETNASVLMFMPGSGLGCAYIGSDGLSLDGDTLAGLETGHAPAPLQLLDGIPPFPCTCAATGVVGRLTPPCPVCPACWR